ncbi:MAG: endopeptidase La [Deltaproteobacteria bacterium]|nr:MAG: endopeptidase La [Deltaproteobacteria bacterium]
MTSAIETPLPLLPLRHVVLLPGDAVPLDVGSAPARAAVDTALERDGRLLLVPRSDPTSDDVSKQALGRIGVEAEILQATPVGRERTMVLVRATRRMALGDLAQTEPYLAAFAEPVADTDVPAPEPGGLTAHMTDRVRELIQTEGEDVDRLLARLAEIENPGELADFAAGRIELSRDQRVALLEQPSVTARLTTLLPLVERRLEVLRRTADIRAELEQAMSPQEREALLRARKRAIEEELGEVDDADPEVAELEQRLAASALPEEAAEAARRQLRRLRDMPIGSPEYATTKTYVERLLALPWSEETEDQVDVARARQILDEDHYGLDDVKRRVIEFIAVRKLAPARSGPILCLVGPPGVGKTSLGRSIARALGRNYVRVALGGVQDEAEIRGHRRTYVGALPGRIVAALERAGSMNPVMVLDEIDKLGQGVRGDPAAALLEVLDPEQNDAFVDHYIEVPVDLSKVLFLATANQTDTIPAPLRDRMEVIHLPGYTEAEKCEIARRHLVPRQLAEHGLDPATVTIDDDAIVDIIRHYTREAGVRNLEREIGAVARHVAVRAASDPEFAGAHITASDIPEILGPPRFSSELAVAADAVGVATGLSWTPVGGEILFVEARLMPGRGRLRVTGRLGDVMEESVRAAHAWVRSRADQLGIDPDRIATSDVHVHVPAGAVRKDGPSAGVAIATALVSAYTNTPVRHDVAMTGEITLRGLVLPVGGIKEKVLAAHRAGVRTVVLPERNRKDLRDIPADVRDALDIRFARRIDDVLAVALRGYGGRAKGRRPAASGAPRNENVPVAPVIAA